jgi:DnaJ-class molecular chaperone
MKHKEARSILGVNDNAQEADIKKAFKKLASKYHPDKEGGDTAKMQEINEAYQALLKPEEDFQGESYGGSGFGGVNVEEIIRRMQEQMHHQQQQHQVQFNISLKEAFNGCNKKVQFNVRGKLITLEFSVPKGCQLNQLVKEHTDDNVSLLLYANITDAKFTLDYEGNIKTQSNISVIKMMIGGWEEVTLFDDSKVNVYIPPGLAAGKILKVKEKGYWKNDTCKSRGDCYIQVLPVIKSLHAEDKELVEQLKKTIEEMP